MYNHGYDGLVPERLGTGKNTQFPFWECFGGILQNTQEIRKFGKVGQFPIKELGYLLKSQYWIFHQHWELILLRIALKIWDFRLQFGNLFLLFLDVYTEWNDQD